MKNSILLLFAVWLSFSALAQIPQAIKYQTVVRDNAGEILANQNISFRMTILQGALPGTVAYSETWPATTNALGIVTLEIGRGTPITGDFEAINWSTTPCFLKTEIDPAGGSAYYEMGISELLSVPYALFAKTAGNGFSGNYNDLTNKPTLWDSTWFSIKNKPTTIAGYGITDAMTTGHVANGITFGDITDWNTAFGWGNHATAGYLTSFTETDPIFAVHPANGITPTLINNWNTAYSNRISTSASTAPLSLTIANNELSGSIATANSSTSGYLTSTDWNIFNNKQNALTFGNLSSSDITISGGNGAVKGSGVTLTIKKGNLTESTSAVLTISGGSNAVLGTGTSILVKQANTSQSGYLSSTDWNSFNNKVSSQWISYGMDISYNTGKVGIGTTTPDPSSALEVSSTNSGVLLPRMTRVQRNAIASPAEGLMVYCSNCGSNGSLSVFTNGSWMTFSACTVAPPAEGSHIMSQGQIIWNWIASPGATGYKWSTTTDYETATDMGTNLLKTETGTLCDTTYNRYIWAYNNCSESGMITASSTVPAEAPARPTAGTHVSTQTSIVWNWNTVPDAWGYKWNTTNDFETADDMGTATSTTETVPCGISYTRYVWAYNGCGYSTLLTLTQSTLDCWLCGDPLPINHVVSGGVAPVDKSVTYGTVTNIPGEASKCWITSNLGADHQATAVNDATDASAGWYWQFNLKQGYQYDGGTLTPSWPTDYIYETTDWVIANDPCNIELGSQWRIPTYTEWYNVDNISDWTNRDGPWNSGLKLHAAGHLYASGGGLAWRGIYGLYRSSTQYGWDWNWILYFDSGSCHLEGNNKASGFPIRCLRD